MQTAQSLSLLVPKYNLLDRVAIKELEVSGTITEIGITLSGVQYLVCYFNNGEAKRTWLFAFEVE
jgi:hypothetical protein